LFKKTKKKKKKKKKTIIQIIPPRGLGVCVYNACIRTHSAAAVLLKRKPNEKTNTRHVTQVGRGGGKFPVSVDHNNRAHTVIISCRALKKCFDCTSVGNESGKTIRRIDLVRPKPSRDLDAIAIRAAVVLEGAYGAYTHVWGDFQISNRWRYNIVTHVVKTINRKKTLKYKSGTPVLEKHILYRNTITGNTDNSAADNDAQSHFYWQVEEPIIARLSHLVRLLFISSVDVSKPTAMDVYIDSFGIFYRYTRRGPRGIFAFF